MSKPAEFEALIFDLDDTLLDTYNLLIPHAVKKAGLVFQESTGLSNTTLNEFVINWNKLHSTFTGRDLFKELINNLLENHKNSLQLKIDSESLITKTYESFLKPELPDTLSLAKYTVEILSDLKQTYKLYLVTQGIPESQKEKIKKLNISSYFKQIFVLNSPAGESKTKAFKEILNLEHCEPKKILSIGNRLSHEIAQAKKLGMKTCHIAIGEHKNEKPQDPSEFADWTIYSLQELKGQCQL
jgi:FMN phosphatase YigB (HAD superfamily)